MSNAKKSAIDKSEEIKKGMKSFNEKFMNKAKKLQGEFSPKSKFIQKNSGNSAKAKSL